MPRTLEFDAGFKKSTGFAEFDTLKLEHGERARIAILENPVVEYVHSLSRVIMRNGAPVMKTVTYGKNNDKTKSVPETDYVGRFICLGNWDVLQEKDVDPDNCPACKASLESPALEGPKRRFALHVLRYQTKKGTTQVVEPFQFQLKVWDFTDARFTVLTDIRMEHGDLRKIDLFLGPCENKMYQKFDVLSAKDCEWQKTPDRINQVKSVLTSQRYGDLTPLLGNKVNVADLQGRVLDVTSAYNIAFGVNSMPAPTPPAAETSDPLPPMTDGGDDPLSIFTGLAPESSGKPQTEAPAPTPSTPATEEKSLEELLGFDFTKQ